MHDADLPRCGRPAPEESYLLSEPCGAFLA